MALIANKNILSFPADSSTSSIWTIYDGTNYVTDTSLTNSGSIIFTTADIDGYYSAGDKVNASIDYTPSPTFTTYSY
jgi:hypothetical protein